MTQKILVTGMSGLIGGAVRRQLEEKYQLSALNRSEVAGVQTFRADIADLEAIRPAFAGQDLVIHLAAKAGGRYTWEEIHQANIVGTYNVFEAARQAGVKRVVYASSGATISGWEQEFPYNVLVEGRYDEAPESWSMLTHETPTRPSGIYGASKVWGEALARHFTDTTGLSVICLRIGMVNREDRPFEPRHFSVWCSQRDIAQMIERCAAAPETIRYDIFYVVSDNKWGYRDISHAREMVGYQPQDAAENYRK
jgi:nucleoside-diphosphate-sugar epimerase